MVSFTFKPKVTLENDDDVIVDYIKNITVCSHTLSANYIGGGGTSQSSVSQFITELAISSATHITGYSRMTIIAPTESAEGWQDLTYEMLVCLRKADSTSGAPDVINDVSVLTAGVIDFSSGDNWLQKLKDKMQNIGLELTNIDEIIFREVKI